MIVSMAEKPLQPQRRANPRFKPTALRSLRVRLKREPLAPLA